VADGTATETDITPQRASELVDSGAVVIDVRRDYEFDAGHIAGARHVEMNDLTANAESIPRDRAVVFCCRSGNRSGMAAAAFREAGFDAYHVEGGLQEWVDQGLELEPPDGEVAEPRTGG
jgi:rhodanese-related sulfurtransferase